MKKNASLFRHLFLSKNFIMMLVMLVVIVMAVSAWFTVNKTVTADNITIEAGSSELDIAEAIKTSTTDGPGVFTDRLTFSGFKLIKDCTGDGVNLIVPDFNVTKDFDSVRLHGGKEVNVNNSALEAWSNVMAEAYNEANPNDEHDYQYYQKEFYIRSKSKELFLDGDSVLLSLTEANGGSLSDALEANSTKRSAYGNFNVDGLVGAIRVALIGEACTNVDQRWVLNDETNNYVPNNPDSTRKSPQKQILWVPRPDVYLWVNPQQNDISNWSLLTGVYRNTTHGTGQEAVPVGEYSYAHQYYANRQSSSGLELLTDENAVISNITATSKTLGNHANISHFDAAKDYEDKITLVVDASDLSVTEEYYVTKYTLKVWIEGTDAEARRAMDGGAFNLTLRFR